MEFHYVHVHVLFEKNSLQNFWSIKSCHRKKKATKEKQKNVYFKSYLKVFYASATILFKF